MQYTETDLASLIRTVETEFTAALAKSESANSAASLSKAEDEKKDKKPSSESKPEGKEKAPAAEANPAEEEAAPAAEAEAEEAAPEAAAAPAVAAEAAPAAAAPAAAGHGYDEEDMAHMQQMYASMSQEELMAHHDAIRAALDACAAAPAAAAPAQAEAAPAAPAAAGAPEMGKSEIKDENPTLNSKATAKGSNTNAAYNKNSGGGQSKTGEPNGSPGAKSPASTDQRNLDNMEKSEKDFDLIKSELDAEKAKSADLKKNLDTVQEFLTKLVTKVAAPKGKAITEVAALAKNEDAGNQGADVNSMSKSEITQKLLQKSQDSKTSPQDRAAINAFYLNGANVNTISHLLK